MTALNILQVTCIVSMGLMSGIYLIFSNTIMPTLRNVQSGADVMAQLNDIILNSTFKFLFFLPFHLHIWQCSLAMLIICFALVVLSFLSGLSSLRFLETCL